VRAHTRSNALEPLLPTCTTLPLLRSTPACLPPILHHLLNPVRFGYEHADLDLKLTETLLGAAAATSVHMHMFCTMWPIQAMC